MKISSIKSYLFTLGLLSVGLTFNGCKNKTQYYSTEDFKSVKKIDTHTHMNMDNPAILEQAKEDNFHLLTLNTDVPSYPSIQEQQKIALSLKKQYPDRLSYLTTFSLDGWNNTKSWQEKTIDYLRKSFNNGALGVKVWKNVGMVFKNDDGEYVMIDNPQFDPIIDFIQEQSKTLKGHIGEPKDCWLPLDSMITNNDKEYYENHPQYHMYLHPEVPSYEEIIKSRDHMLDKHPDLRFSGAHLGSMEWSLDMMAEHLDKYPNLVFDTAARISDIEYLTQQDREKTRNFFFKYQDRIIYATDTEFDEGVDPDETKKDVHNTWTQDWRFFVTGDSLNVPEVNGSFRGLKLPKKIIDKLYRKNAEKRYPGI